MFEIRYHKYADDTKFYILGCSSESFAKALSQHLEAVKFWEVDSNSTPATLSGCGCFDILVLKIFHV